MLPIIENSKQYGNHTAIIDATGVYTYQTLWQDANNLALRLQALAIGSEAVLFLLPSSYQYVVVQWAIWLCGKMAVPLHTAQTASEIDYLIQDTGADVLIYCSSTEQQLKAVAIGATRFISLSEIQLLTTEAALQEVTLSSNALMIYTSGTTGKPKGVVISHHQLDAQIRSLSAAWAWTSTDSILNVLPMHHLHGVINITCCALYNGATLELQSKFEPQYVADRMANKSLTLFMAVPTVYHKLAQYFDGCDPEVQKKWQQGMQAMRLMVCGSAALPIPVLQKWERISGHTLLERYGMTEIGMALSNPLRGERRPGAVGMPLPYVQVKLVSDEGDEITDADTPGELYVKGATVFEQYWHKPAETAAAFEDGWFKTGDVASCSQDGYYTILGRKSSDIIKSGGYKISALEIENVLLSCTGVNECAVVALPDEVWGERIVAVIVGTATEATLKAWTADRLSQYKIPRQYYFVASLPRNAMGKVLKSALKNELQ